MSSESVLPFAQRREDGQRFVAGRALRTRRGHDLGRVAAQERVDAAFDADRRGQGGRVGGAHREAALFICRALGVAGFDRSGEAQVRQGVLVRAAHLGVGRQRGQTRQRIAHLRRRALEQPTAARGEERVAAEEQRRRGRAVGVAGLDVSDVPGGVARHLEHREAHAEHVDAVAVVQWREGFRDPLARRAVDRAVEQRTQVGDAADVIGMVVRH